MHELIASYLFQNHNCPLPGLGNLSMSFTGARTDFSNNLIIAPNSSIQFARGETNTALLLTWLANKTHADQDEVATALAKFCVQLKDNAGTKGSGATLEGIGDFIADSHGNISFVPAKLPNAFSQPVPAEHVTRLDAAHNMLVGDKETTNIAMTEYLNEETPKKDRWWIWAMVLGAIGLSLILLYALDKNASAEFGNAIKILSLL